MMQLLFKTYSRFLPSNKIHGFEMQLSKKHGFIKSRNAWCKCKGKIGLCQIIMCNSNGIVKMQLS